MPYIGQRPATGEHNSFKILDDISNYTLTFGSSDIDVSADTITAREHRFVTGQRVTYGNGGGTDPTGLSNGTVYYIIVEDRHTFKLATNASNAVAGTAINITAAGAGAAHTINVAFDGVNTKFKATHTNGTKADITQSGQLMVSVNGVLQQPHDNTTTPTTGYATDHTSTIIFSAAPAAGDQFFGRLIASNFATFDISDNTVDNFTGDGSTSTFTLSKTPPNNESVLVTIDGVVQYPDDNAAVRAYTVSENVLDFASAPGNAVEIQVRHIGFAGASTAAVSGFYGRTGNAALKNTDDIVFRNANVGVVTATDIRVTGNLTVDGTTTTLDTELVGVDKLEVSANNTTSAGIITQTGSGDILNLYDGSTEVFTVTDGGNIGIGITNPTVPLFVQADSPSAIFKLASTTATSGYHFAFGWADNSLYHRIRTAGGSNDGFIIENINSKVSQYFASSGEFRISTNSNTRLTVTSGGYVGINETNPTQQLSVHDDTNYQGILINGNQAPRLTFAKSNSTTVEWGVGIDGTNGNNFAIAQAGNTAKFIIDANGNIGINENSPEAKLELDGRFRILDNSDGTPSTGKGLEISYYTSDDKADILSYDRGGGAYKKLQLRGSSIELKKNNTVLCNIGTGGSGVSVGFSTTSNLVTNAEKIAVRGYSSFKSTNPSYAAIYLGSEGNTTDTANQLLMFNAGGANRGGIGYVPNTGELRFNHQYFMTFCTGATLLGGTERLRITSSGLVGIGTISPTGVLDINSTSGSYDHLRLRRTNSGAGDSDWSLKPYAGSLYFRTAGANDKIVFTSGGLVGINDTSPDTQLSVNSGGTNVVAKFASTDQYAWIQFRDNSTTDTAVMVGADGDNLLFRSGSNERVRVTSGGIVLINDANVSTNRADAPLQIETGGNGNALNLRARSSDNIYSYLNFQNNAGSQTAAHIYLQRDASNNAGTLVFGTAVANANTPTERFTIRSDGRIAIGTQTINTDSMLSIHRSSSDQCQIRFTNTTTGEGGNNGLIVGIDNNEHGRIFNMENNPLRLGTNNTERFRITSGGFVNIGGNFTQTSYTAQVTRIGGNTDVMQIKGNVGNAFIRFADNDATSDFTLGSDDGSGAGAGTFVLYDRNNTVYRVVVNSSGNIGVRNTNPSSKVHIGDLIGSASNDANTTHTSLIIKQTNNDNKSGFYIERSGERKGYYMWMNPGGGSGDGLTFTRNNNGTKSNALILDRDANIWGGGTFYPLSDNAYDLGSSSNRWRNVYTTDLQLSNEGSQNDVDGTWGSYTIQEGEDELFLINRRNGKKYKFNLTEVN